MEAMINHFLGRNHGSPWAASLDDSVPPLFLPRVFLSIQNPNLQKRKSDWSSLGHVPPKWAGGRMWLASHWNSMEWTKGSSAKGEMLLNNGSLLLGPHVILKPTVVCGLLWMLIFTYASVLHPSRPLVLGGQGWELRGGHLCLMLRFNMEAQRLAQCLTHNWCSVSIRWLIHFVDFIIVLGLSSPKIKLI